MGIISKVYYKNIPLETCNMRTAGEYYYHANLLGLTDKFNFDYELYETNQIELRNKLIGDSKRSGEIQGSIDINSAMIGVSSIKNNVIIVANVR